MEDKLIAIVNQHGHDGVLDISSLDLSWMFWDDDIDERTDENGETLIVESLYLTLDGYGLMVKWSNGTTNAFSSLDYIDDDYYNCASYIYDEITWAYK